MVSSGEIDMLVPERVWQETRNALAEDQPQVFFQTLAQCGALARVFPEIEALFGVPQPATWHPEIDTGIHTMMVLQQAAQLSSDTRVRFAALTHDLGKGETPRDQWPSHRGHEERSVRLVQELCQRLRIPNDYRAACRRPDRLDLLLLACEADARGRKGLENEPYPQADLFRDAYAAATGVTASALDRESLSGAQIGQQLRRLRVKAIAEAVELARTQH